MINGLLFVIVPLVLGYLISISNQQILARLNQTCSYLVVFILFLMGISIAALDELGLQLGQIIEVAGVLFVCISACNLLMLPVLDRHVVALVRGDRGALPIKAMFTGAGKLILSVIIGIALGLFIKSIDANGLSWVNTASEWVLLILLVLVGISLRNSDMSLKQILVNPKGLIIATGVVLSSLLGGLVAAYWLELPLNQGLAMASGFGWYSLTGIIVTEHLGPILGSGAFLNELLREIIAILIIPCIIGRLPSTAIGFAGSTAMDFSLPVIQQNGGNQFVPQAIISGFILSLLVPVLVTFFLTL